MNLPNLKEAKVRTKNKVDIVNNAYNIPEEVKNIGKNKTEDITDNQSTQNIRHKIDTAQSTLKTNLRI